MVGAYRQPDHAPGTSSRLGFPGEGKTASPLGFRKEMEKSTQYRTRSPVSHAGPPVLLGQKGLKTTRRDSSRRVLSSLSDYIGYSYVETKIWL